MKETTMENTTAKAPGKAAPHRILKTMTKVHVFLHGVTGGRLGNTMAGQEVCFVTMTGAKSGRQIAIPLIYVPYENGVLLVASQTGRDTNPVWYNNLVKQPEIEVRHRGDSLKLRARQATTEEKTDLWPICDEVYADFALYRARTTRDIPIFVCESA
jgi:deazaflavin-dependent oxidoreductase (nitroreductase family)